MARYEHLPIYRAAFDLAVHVEKIVKSFKPLVGCQELVGPSVHHRCYAPGRGPHSRHP